MVNLQRDLGDHQRAPGCLVTACRASGTLLYSDVQVAAEGMKRWVGLGVMADTLISMGNVLAARA